MPMEIILLLEPNKDKYQTSSKFGHLYMNRFAIDEEAKFEIIKVVELGESYRYITKQEQKEKGKRLNRILVFHFCFIAYEL